MPSLARYKVVIHAGRLTSPLKSRALSRQESLFVLAGGSVVGES
jgi:hypothetical protein